jgi:hypothetical protein
VSGRRLSQTKRNRRRRALYRERKLTHRKLAEFMRDINREFFREMMFASYSYSTDETGGGPGSTLTVRTPAAGDTASIAHEPAK